MHRLVIASVTLIGLVGAVVVAGYLFLFSATTDRAATFAPANTAIYVNVHLQPSTGQMMNLAELIGRLPGFADDASLDEKVDQVIQNVLSNGMIDYRAHLKPWLGDRVSLAAWPTGSEATEVAAVILAETSDPDIARSSLDSLSADQGFSITSETYEGIELRVGPGRAYAVVDGMVAFGTSVEAVKAVVDASGGADSLAEQARFREAIDDLPDDHLASIYVDIAGIAAATGATDAVEGVTTASAVLVAEPSGLRVSGSAPLAGTAAGSGAAAPAPAVSTLAEWMPADTIAEAVIFDLRSLFEQAEGAIGSAPGGEDVGGLLDSIRAIAAFGLGIDLDTDVLPLFDGEVGIALGGLGEGGLPSGQLLLRPSDPESAQALIDNLTDALTGAGATMATEPVAGVEIVTLELPATGSASFAVVDGVVILGLGTADVRAALEAGPAGDSLADSTSYAAGFEPMSVRAGTEIWVDVAALFEELGGGLELPDDGRDILSRIGTFAITIPSRHDQIEFHAALTVIDPGAE